jgi:hypothetical protein
MFPKNWERVRKKVYKHMNSTLVQKQRVLFIRQKNNQFEEHQKIIIPLPCPFLGGTFPRASTFQALITPGKA